MSEDTQQEETKPKSDFITLRNGSVVRKYAVMAVFGLEAKPPIPGKATTNNEPRINLLLGCGTDPERVTLSYDTNEEMHLSLEIIREALV